MSDTGLPYTWTDPQGARLTVDGELIYVAIDGIGSTGVDTPTGADAVALARAVLAAAGDTDHMVVSIQDSERTIRIRESIAAETMRDQVVDLLVQDNPLAALFNPLLQRIRNLPLLPDAKTTQAAEKKCPRCGGTGHAPDSVMDAIGEQP